MLLLELPPRERQKIKAFFEELGHRPILVEEGEICGLVIQEKFLESVLEILGMQEAGRREDAKYEGFTIVHAQFPPKDLGENVICQDWYVDFSAELVELLNAFAIGLRNLGMERLVVCAKAPNRRQEEVPSDFRLNLFQSPKEGLVPLSRDHMFGTLAVSANKLLPYSNQGIPIYDEHLVVGAELNGLNDLYILFNISPRTSSEELAALQQCLFVTLELLRLGEAERKLHKEQYWNLQVKRIEGTIEEQISALVLQARELIEEKRSEIEEAQADLAQMYRELTNLEETESQARGQAQQMKQKLRQEYLLVKGIPKVLDVSWENGVFVVLTEELIGFDPRTDLHHAFGEFRIELNPLAEDGGSFVRLVNLTKRGTRIGDRSMAAPHVRASGHPCLGDFHSSLPRAVREFRLFDAVNMAIDLVQNVNVRDPWGSDIQYWPEVAVTVKDSVARRAQPE